MTFRSVSMIFPTLRSTPITTLFPYTTLFRSDRRGGGDADQPAGCVEERAAGEAVVHRRRGADHLVDRAAPAGRERPRSEEHTSELQSRGHLVCRLLLEKKKSKRGGTCEFVIE